MGAGIFPFGQRGLVTVWCCSQEEGEGNRDTQGGIAAGVHVDPGSRYGELMEKRRWMLPRLGTG